MHCITPCKKCSANSIYANLCKKHLVEYVQDTVVETIKEFDLLSEKDKVMVAASGGKDSLTVLDIVSMIHKDVTALAIDEGIEDYRKSTLEDLKKFCDSRSIKLKIVSFKDEYGKTLNEIMQKGHVSACRVCGVFRRQLMNRFSKDYDVIVTGHNMDDELQSIMMNLWKGNLQLAARAGPKTGVIESSRFVKRIKPLYFIPEKMVRIYTILQGFDVKFVECPYAHDSFRHKVGSILNKWESESPGVKENFIRSFLKLLPGLKEKYKTDEPVIPCVNCGQPSASGICRACNYVDSFI